MENTSIHLLRSSPFAVQQASLMLTLLTPDDAIVLLDDGCYLNNHQLLADILAVTSNVYAITPHMTARALIAHASIKKIHLAQLTELIFTYSNSVTWQ
ncbi:hypothetical protein tinsulaeT_37510 [Thalassotalea insulae]|uniref:Sulfurtransferase complex subunit TusB n=1 Tax=Thalassotalea insulae TaxID=2056778 RepID=A0ABQ6GWU1_9GAMM|nr:sulfurtransferase complex subunit TusB [Thalassotalea insulae]GLX80411.1 hypothetical protein tinsulaeT_37510 [Thalassotalea insulae]